MLRWRRSSALPQVDAARCAAIGFCFGGSVVLELARAGADLKAVCQFSTACWRRKCRRDRVR